MNLTSQNVSNTFIGCLFKKDENTDSRVVVDGITIKVGFNPERLNEARPKIEAMLNDLPDSFKVNGGGGMSFLNIIEDKNGNQWVDLHHTADQLVCLGIAIGKLKFLMPRELWSMFPGGMPYLQLSA